MKKTAGVLIGILMVLVFASSANAAILLQQTQENGQIPANDYYVNSVAQSIKESQTLSGVKKLTLGLARRNSWSASAILSVSIQTSTTPSGGGSPSGTIVSQAQTILINDIPIEFGYFTFIFPAAFDIPANTEYWIVISTNEGSTSTNCFLPSAKCVGPRMQGASGAYPNGQVKYKLKSNNQWQNQGGDWGSNRDFYFIFESAPLPPPPDPVAPSLRLPFRDGEEWGVTCYYNGNGPSGPNDPGCGFHVGTDAYALDFNLPGEQDKGSPVLSVAQGKVETVNYCSPNCASGTYGNYVMINHGNGYKSRYAHLGAVVVKVGQYVFQGEQIGAVGDSGAPGNYHLHFVLYYDNGTTINSVVPEPMSGYSGYTGFQSCTVSSPPSGSCYTSTNTTPVAIYHFDTTLDSSSNGNSGTTTTCLIAGCLGLNGTSGDYIEIPNSSSLQLTGDMSIVFWLKPENVGSGRINPVEKAWFGEFSLVIEIDGRLSYYHGQSTSNYFSWTALTSGSIANNQGIRIVITRNSSTNTVKSYTNGALIATTSYGISPSTSTNPLRIGLGNTNVPYKGKQDEITIYPRVLTDDEINNDYYATQ